MRRRLFCSGSPAACCATLTAGAKFRVKEKQLPAPGRLSALSAPPISSTSWLLIESPNPVPP